MGRMKNGQTYTAVIGGLDPDGLGTVEIEGRVVRVPGAIPGDSAVIRIRSVKRHTAAGELDEMPVPAVERIDPECPHFGLCGGCRWRNIPYETQCGLKAGIVRTALATVPGIGSLGPVSVVPSPEVMYFRNKMEYSFDSPPGAGEAFLGLHAAGRFNQVFDVTGCRLLSERSNAILAHVRDFAMTRNLSVYGLRSHRGILRFLVVREGRNTGETMVNLVTSGDPFPEREEFVLSLVEAFPDITTVVHTVNRMTGSTSSGQEQEILHGPGHIRDTIGKYPFTISPDAFFQTNTRQAENLYGTIREFAALAGRERLLDLYCGTGTIGIFLADGAASVRGVEIVGAAVEDARRNAALNGVRNISFDTGPVEDILDNRAGDCDVVICDPPRAGIHPRALARLVMLRIPRMVYVSCNIKALPGDLETLVAAGYRVRDVRVFDMSPHTPHVETVVKLEIG